MRPARGRSRDFLEACRAALPEGTKVIILLALPLAARAHAPWSVLVFQLEDR